MITCALLLCILSCISYTSSIGKSYSPNGEWHMSTNSDECNRQYLCSESNYTWDAIEGPSDKRWHKYDSAEGINLFRHVSYASLMSNSSTNCLFSRKSVMTATTLTETCKVEHAIRKTVPIAGLCPSNLLHSMSYSPRNQ